ncbi:hypothetical protein OpiT1DRAFT_03938 [Opitutaceae bacterium TAV1]|nr:hypothetical protein OpiT1DRAFT_03938 [Opitutaceae bacterium TAV1]
MTHAVFTRRKRLFAIVLALLSVVGLGAAAVAWRLWGPEIAGLFHESVAWVRSLGAFPYFTAMAILPALGMPISIFNLSAGPLFGPVIGLPRVLVFAATSLGINVALGYVVARWLLRPWAIRLCTWLGYHLPEVRGEGSTSLIMIVRFAPGPPYALQNLLLGVAAVPFWPYFFISWVAACSFAFALIIFGDALVKGRGGMALFGISLLVALTVGIRILRKQISARRLKREHGAAGATAATSGTAAAVITGNDTPPPTP